MPSNPMQKKARNSFLLGAGLMLIVSILIGAVLYLLVFSESFKSKEEKEQTVSYVYKLKTNVTQGDEISSSMVEAVEVNGKVSSDAFPAKKMSADGKKLDNVSYPSGHKAKTDLLSGTILTQSMLYEEDIDKTLRYVEYGMLTLPSELEIGDFIDIRLSVPTGEDYVVLSKIRIENLVTGSNTIGINLDEESILTLTCAIIDGYVIPASNLYVTEFVDASIQEAINKTYIVSDNVRNLIQKQELGNISSEAIMALNERWTGGANENVRATINSNRNYSGEDALDNIEEGILKQIEDAKKARAAYLSEMSGE